MQIFYYANFHQCNHVADPDCGNSHAGENAFPEGGPNGKRVVGGWEATPNSVSWMASLLWNGGHFCGASIVTSNHVITAAHCVAGE